VRCLTKYLYSRVSVADYQEIRSTVFERQFFHGERWRTTSKRSLLRSATWLRCTTLRVMPDLFRSSTSCNPPRR